MIQNYAQKYIQRYAPVPTFPKKIPYVINGDIVGKLDFATTLGDPGSNTTIVSEHAIRKAFKGRIRFGEIKAKKITLDTPISLDDIADGTYGRVLSTAISAGRIVLTSYGVTGSLSVDFTDADISPGFPSDENLVGYWALDDGSGAIAVDGSGHWNNGTLVNMEEGDWVDGVVGKCLSIGGTNEYIECGDIGIDHVAGKSTVSFWLNYNASADNTIPLNMGNADETRLFNVHIQANSEIRIGIVDPTFIYRGWADNVDDEWHHYVLVVDLDASFIYVYRDGELHPSGALSFAGSVSDTNIFRLGRYVAGAFHYTGLIDEVRIYDQGLTPSEIKSLFLYPAGNRTTVISGYGIRTGIIQSTNWAANAGAAFNLDNKWIKMGGSNVTAAGAAAGIFLGLDTDYKVYIGDGANAFFKFDAVKIQWKAANTELDASGNLIASSVTLSGAMTIGAGSSYAGDSISITYTEADVTGSNDCQNPGDYTASNAQNLGWIIGTAGSLTISAGGKLVLNTADALEIYAAGNIKLYHGADILFYADGGALGASIEENDGHLSILTGTALKKSILCFPNGNTELYYNDGIRIEANYYGCFIYGNLNIGGNIDIAGRFDALDNYVGHVVDIRNDGNNINRKAIRVQCGQDTPTDQAANMVIEVFDGNGSQVGWLSFDDNTLKLFVASDAKLKKDIVDTTMNGVEIINNIKVRDYERITSGVKHTGFVADDLESVYPEAVRINDGIKGVSSESFIVPLVKSVQELEQRVKLMEAP